MSLCECGSFGFCCCSAASLEFGRFSGRGLRCAALTLSIFAQVVRAGAATSPPHTMSGLMTVGLETERLIEARRTGRTHRLTTPIIQTGPAAVQQKLLTRTVGILNAKVHLFDQSLVHVACLRVPVYVEQVFINSLF